MGGRNFSLTERLSEFIDQQVEDGRHQNASEVVREALRRYQDDLEAERASLAAIEAVADRGIAALERGDFRLVNGEEDRRALLADLNRRASGRAAARKD
ncbi:type II toxin-antitoxin system ParD family antitoxin [Azospirillum thermophilum]|uniref:Type II toxin-antitoxin system ParD family antitoxin n=1 Tax=Azospirillum thermophilum TaxID=2202148 RepID=A0A2S2CYA9_9PROT|nr:type II toxin-antitoxin system ParD family antitoxin [Azospirillum thermophilum]AWK89438.1 type II toxin-antitoxin system ParD family antitoxin [Azospirillum thermophilum]